MESNQSSSPALRRLFVQRHAITRGNLPPKRISDQVQLWGLCCASGSAARPTNQVSGRPAGNLLVSWGRQVTRTLWPSGLPVHTKHVPASPRRSPALLNLVFSNTNCQLLQFRSTHHVVSFFSDHDTALHTPHSCSHL